MSFDGRDISGAELKKLVQTLHDELKNKTDTDIKSSAAVKALVKGVSVGGNASFDGKWLNDHQEAHDMHLEMEGNIYLPVGLKVYAVQAVEIKKSGEFGEEIRRSFRRDITKSVRLTSSDTVLDEDRLSAAEGKLAQLDLVGSVAAFAGPTDAIPNGWLLCDGRVLPREGAYKRLFDVIKTAHGAGTNSSTFNLPDYRGMFLRGVNLDSNDAFADPNAKARTNAVASGTATGNQVGSVQTDELKKHSHTFRAENVSKHNNGPYVARDDDGNDTSTTQTTSEVGGDESRPKNICVHYIIKF